MACRQRVVGQVTTGGAGGGVGVHAGGGHAASYPAAGTVRYRGGCRRPLRSQRAAAAWLDGWAYRPLTRTGRSVTPCGATVSRPVVSPGPVVEPTDFPGTEVVELALALLGRLAHAHQQPHIPGQGQPRHQGEHPRRRGPGDEPDQQGGHEHQAPGPRGCPADDGGPRSGRGHRRSGEPTRCRGRTIGPGTWTPVGVGRRRCRSTRRRRWRRGPRPGRPGPGGAVGPPPPRELRGHRTTSPSVPCSETPEPSTERRR